MNGIDVRGTLSQLLFRVFLQTAANSFVTSGTTTLELYELQNADASLKTYGWMVSAFSAGSVTSAFGLMSNQLGNSGATSTGLWTLRLSAVSAFTSGNVYFALVSSTSAVPQTQCREFQFGGAEGDMATVSGNLLAQVASYQSLVFPGIKRNQALSAFQFMMTDSTNHSATAGLTVTCLRSVSAGSYIAGNLGAVSEVSYGMYTLDLSATDLSGANTVLRATATGADATFVTLITST